MEYEKEVCFIYEDEHRWYGEFIVSFQTFIEQPERYIKGIFANEFAE